MPLEQWFKNGWLKAHQPSRNEIAGLLAIVERDLADARADGLSADWKFGIAYNAALKLCAILLHAEGYKAEKNLNHYRTIHALGEVFPERKADVHYLDACRAKRNAAEYESVGIVAPADSDELVEFICEFKPVVLEWLRKKHPELV
ncbi:MAG: hypothetical protein DRP64_14185 [Verrucomicrobia bacterium]|nr:MAG: hypothetical protein DRP64_14185 [Verrucomicrobiota bacterium]